MPYPNRVFGQAMKKQSRYQRQFGGKNGKALPTLDTKAEEAAARKRLRQEQGELIDAKFGYNRLEDLYQEQQRSRNFRSEKPRIDVDKLMQRRGWLFNMAATTVRVFELDVRK